MPPNYLNEKYDLDDPSLVSVIDELPLWSAPFGFKLLDTVKIMPAMKVLDIGCGLGFPLIELANRLGESCQLFGLDPWGKAIERVQLKVKLHGLKNVSVVQDRAEKMPFASNFFHLIVSNNGINNVQEPEQVLRQCYRVCQPGGQMVLTVNLPDTMLEFYQIVEQVLESHHKTAEIAAMRQHIYEKRKPMEETRAMIQTAGFKVNRLVEDIFTMRFLNGSAMLSHFGIKLGFLSSWKAILSPTEVDLIFPEIENELNRIADQIGELRLTIPFVCLDCIKEI